MRNFGKVYFPRIIVPISIVISNLLKFGIQFCIFIAFYLYYYFQGAAISLNAISFFPLLIVVMGILGLGLGMFISSLNRDFSYLIGFGVQLLMYLSAWFTLWHWLKKNAGLCLARSIHWLILKQPVICYWMLGTYLYGDWVIPLGYRCLVISGVLIFNRTEIYANTVSVPVMKCVMSRIKF
jgi:lipopolysaccharide transport system permease protein